MVMGVVVGGVAVNCFCFCICFDNRALNSVACIVCLSTMHIYDY